MMDFDCFELYNIKLINRSFYTSALMLCTVNIFENACSDLVLNQEHLDLQSNALPSQLSGHVVATYMSLSDSDMNIMKLQTFM